MKHDKSIGAYQQEAAATEEVHVDKKALSPGSDLAFADYPAERWQRLPFSEAEIDTINMGTNEINQDWNSIKL